MSAPSQITIARATRPSPDAYVQHVRVHLHFGLRAAARMSRRWSVRDGSAQGRSHRSRAADVPAENARFLGIWTGHWSGPNSVCIVVAVREIASDGTAQVTFAYPGRVLWQSDPMQSFLA